MTLKLWHGRTKALLTNVRGITTAHHGRARTRVGARGEAGSESGAGESDARRNPSEARGSWKKSTIHRYTNQPREARGSCKKNVQRGKFILERKIEMRDPIFVIKHTRLVWRRLWVGGLPATHLSTHPPNHPGWGISVGIPEGIMNDWIAVWSTPRVIGQKRQKKAKHLQSFALWKVYMQT